MYMYFIKCEVKFLGYGLKNQNLTLPDRQMSDISENINLLQ